MITLLSGLWSKAWGYILAVGAAIAALLYALARARQAGIDHVQAEQKEKTDEVRAGWDEIDRGAVDFDASIERLRKRNG
jgi:hypothetical protein